MDKDTFPLVSYRRYMFHETLNDFNFALAPLSLTTQVCYQWKSTGQVPERSDSEEPAEKVTCDVPVFNWSVLGLPFSTAIFRSLPIDPPPLTHTHTTPSPK